MVILNRVFNKIKLQLTRKYYGVNCFIDQQVRIEKVTNFQADKSSALYHGAYIQNPKGSFKIGCNSHLGAFCYVNVVEGNCTIGNDVSIGPGTKIIVYSNHYEKGKKNTEVRICKDISIGNDVFIGANCTILPGSTIEDKVIVGAGSVVKGILKSNFIYIGILAKPLKRIDEL